MPAATTLLSVTIAVTTITISWPQIWLSCVRGRTSGLSPMSTVLGPTLNLTWLTYGFLTASPLQIVVNSLMGLGNLAVLAALLLTRRDLLLEGLTRILAAPAVLLSVVALSALAVAGGLSSASIAGQLVGVAGTVFGAVAVIPQPLALVRDRSQDVSGVSTGRFMLAAASGSLWLVHGVLGGEPAVISSAFLGMTSAAVVLHCVARSRRSAGRTVDLTSTRMPALAGA